MRGNEPARLFSIRHNSQKIRWRIENVQKIFFPNLIIACPELVEGSP
jgi:hypothetical protein